MSAWSVRQLVADRGPAAVSPTTVELAGVGDIKPVSAFATPPQGSTGGAGVPSINDAIDNYRLGRITQRVAMSIPAVRRAMHQLMAIATFQFAAWTTDGVRVAPLPPALSWLRQPDPRATLFETIGRTVRDAVWFDRSAWLILDRRAGALPTRFQHLGAGRLSWRAADDNPERQVVAMLDGEQVKAGGKYDPRDIVVFDWAGLGGIESLGAGLLNLYLDLQAAAGNYARAPLPSLILKNSGLDLSTEDAQALVDKWEAARGLRSTGYLNSVLDADTVGWNASELQLTEGREYSALETARLFGLPAYAVDAAGGDSMTYGNVSQRRKDTAEALRPWFQPIEQTLSITDREIDGRLRGRYIPRDLEVKFDASGYTREDPEVRAQTWSAWKAIGIGLDEIRANEPLLSALPTSSNDNGGQE